MRTIQKPPERMLFGQFLLEQKLLTGNEIALALYKQSKERIHNHTVRRLGTILLEDYQVFKTEQDLQNALQAFRDYKEEMNSIYNDAREIVHTERLAAQQQGCSDDDNDDALGQAEFDLGDIDIEELQGYVTAVDTFLEAAEEVSEIIRLKQCAREEMIEIMKRMAGIRQALLSIATKG